MLDLIAKLNSDGVQWEYVYINKQLFVKYDGNLIPWYF